MSDSDDNGTENGGTGNSGNNAKEDEKDDKGGVSIGVIVGASVGGATAIGVGLFFGIKFGGKWLASKASSTGTRVTKISQNQVSPEEENPFPSERISPNERVSPHSGKRSAVSPSHISFGANSALQKPPTHDIAYNDLTHMPLKQKNVIDLH